MKQIGFFGGTFDPIHFGHLNLAIELLEKGHLDHILFCPARCSPFKIDHPPVADPRSRFRLVDLAIGNLPHFSATSIEIEREGPSYTIDTLRALEREGEQFRLILSEEAADRFHQWHQPDEIIRLAPPIIGARSIDHTWKGPYGPLFKKNLIQTARFDISSTAIRDRLKKKLTCAHLIPAKALDYIIQHRLYSSL